MTQKINLPPLPDLPSYPAEVFDRETNVVSETVVEQLMRDYARVAIEADRQARGNPVAWLRNERGGYGGKAVFDPMVILGSPPPIKTVNGATYSPVFDAPQPQQIPEPHPWRESMCSNHRSFAEGWDACRRVMIESSLL